MRINLNHSRAGWLSIGGIMLALALIVMSIALSLKSLSYRYWPLLFVGLTIGIISTPFYYLYKNQEPYDSETAALNALSQAGKNLAIEKRKQQGKET